MTMADVTVRGAGIFGLSIAWACVQRGASVQVVDPFGPGAGASGGVVGALAPHVPENWNPKKQFQLESLLMAKPFWASVSEAGGKNPGYARTGRLQPIADAHALELAQNRAQGASDLWGEAAEWRLVDAGDHPDWAPLSPTGRLVYDTLSGRMHPRQTVAALVAALNTKGVEVVAEATTQGKEVWATGTADLFDISKATGKAFGNGVKGQGAVLTLDQDTRNLPQLFANTVHVIPHADGTVAIGSTSEREYSDPTAVDAQLDDVVAKARAAVPALENAQVIERWAGVRPRSRSRAPVLGDHPTRPGAFIANGGFKIGFGMAPKVAQVMADLILDGRDAIPDGFRAEDSLTRRR